MLGSYSRIFLWIFVSFIISDDIGKCRIILSFSVFKVLDRGLGTNPYLSLGFLPRFFFTLGISLPGNLGFGFLPRFL